MAYINGIGIISPQKTSDSRDFLAEIVEHNAEYLKCIEPNYKEFIDPLAARRMSRLIKMGIASARICLRDADIFMPDAIITGTGLGSVEDTEKILSSIYDENVIFNPTPFIQSTYNTISSQIAIILKCHNYNSTYVHRIFSFESGLQDALLQIEEGTAKDVLAGGIDEMTLNHLNIIRRLGHLKREPESNLGLLQYKTPGALAGEGSAYFLLSKESTPHTYAKILGVKTIYRPANGNELKNQMVEFLERAGIKLADLDLLLTGINGNASTDTVYHEISSNIFPGIPMAWYKHLCGEYSTSTGFALWLSARILQTKQIPEIIMLEGSPSGSPKNILILNSDRKTHYSLILASSI